MFHAVFAILFATGSAWWVAQAYVGRDNSPIVASAAPWLLKVHGAAAMAALAVLGTLYPLHIIRGWRARRNRVWGGVLAAVCGVLVATGYLLYYAGGETVREAASAIHIWLGLGFPVVLIVHIWRGRVSKSA